MPLFSDSLTKVNQLESKDHINSINSNDNNNNNELLKRLYSFLENNIYSSNAIPDYKQKLNMYEWILPNSDLYKIYLQLGKLKQILPVKTYWKMLSNRNDNINYLLSKQNKNNNDPMYYEIQNKHNFADFIYNPKFLTKFKLIKKDDLGWK